MIATADADRHGALFRCWVRKEAFVKALGLDISCGLGRFAVSMEAQRPDFAAVLVVEGPPVCRHLRFPFEAPTI